MTARLVGIAGPFKGVSFPVVTEQVSIGRDSVNSLWASDPSLSRRHCLLYRQADRLSIKDLDSRNGTLVNGVPVVEQELHDQDQICVGESLLVLIEDETNPEQSPVVLTETAELEALVLLRQQDAKYLPSETAAVSLPQTDRTIRDLNTLVIIATRIGGIRDRESLEWQLLGMVFDIVPADRGAILHFGDDVEAFDSAIAWDRIRGPRAPVQVSSAVVRRVFRERLGLLISDVAVDNSLEGVETLKQLGVHSLLCVPLLGSERLEGMIYLDSQSPSQRIDENHLQLMTAIAGLASLALENVRQWEELREENRALRGQISLEHNMVGGSAPMRVVYDFIRKVAPSDSTVLIQGESGTGKELVARAIHQNSTRSRRHFVAINCAALSETLLESELFGHEKGAFTGAIAQKKGKLEIADGGTLFLDEVSEMTPALQAKLLRVLQEREFERVGGTSTHKVDVRFISATNKNLFKMVDEALFRKDLYYRLNIVALTMPPLRDRRQDIPALAEHFISKVSKKCGMPRKRLSPEAQSVLINYDWPGNVRELENAIERAIVLGTSETLLPDDLPDNLLEGVVAGAPSPAKYYAAVKDAKKQIVLQSLQQASGNYIEAARSLGLHPNSLLRLIRSLGLKSAAKG